MSNYRIVIAYSPTKQAFIAKAPEIHGCEVEGATRSEVVAKIEEEMIAQLANMKEKGSEIPVPVEDLPLDGNLQIKVSASLHGDLVFMARQEEVELDILLVELLTRGVNQRGFRRQHSEGRGRRMEGQGNRYHEIMENRADFIEYVRGLETGSSNRGGYKGGNRGKR
jgi:predicted RNase H-like HicB family nuclease